MCFQIVCQATAAPFDREEERIEELAKKLADNVRHKSEFLHKKIGKFKFKKKSEYFEISRNVKNTSRPPTTSREVKR